MKKFEVNNHILTEGAIALAVNAIRNDPDHDWQAAQHVLADHPVVGPWLRSRQVDANDLTEIMGIVTEAEQRFHEQMGAEDVA